MGPGMILLIIAMVCFLLAIVDYPPGQSLRFIAAGLFLWVLSVLIGTRV